jgi:hypothetical protein
MYQYRRLFLVVRQLRLNTDMISSIAKVSAWLLTAARTGVSVWRFTAPQEACVFSAAGSRKTDKTHVLRAAVDCQKTQASHAAELPEWGDTRHHTLLQ